MAVFVYPGSDLDRANALLAVLGSFWARTYAASDQVRSYTTATAQSVAQSHRNLLEVAAALSRFEVPLYHTESWVPIALRKSEMNAGLVGAARFNDGLVTFDDNKARFDQPIARATYAFPKPEKLVSAAQMFNKLVVPTVALSENVDFYIDETRSAIVFTADPFERPDFLRRIIYENSQPVDEEITIWAFQGQFDYEYVFNQFAYALGMRLKTSQGFKNLMNAVIDGLVNGGATALDLDLAFSAICGIPLATETETVEVLQRDAHGIFIATDKHVYRFPDDAVPVVAAGDRVRAGSPLVDALTVVPLTDGTVPVSVSALALDGGYLAACFYADLVFENKELPLEVRTDHPSGYTFVRFPLGGFPADAERFFDELHARGVAAAQFVPDPCDRKNRKLGTLAHLLDRRAQPSGEPNASHLPATINPLQFIAKNILRNNVFLVRIRAGALGQNRLGLYNMRHLRQLLPPHSAMIVIYEIGGIRDSVNGEDNVSSGASTFTGAEPLTDAVTEEMVRDVGATARALSGTCQ
jgi:hypothetical protein